MRKIQNHNLSQLLMEIRFTPQGNRRKQLEAAEKLFEIVDRHKKYPFEFVCFKITGFHPKNLPELPLIKGDSLADDLQIFILKLSGMLAQLVSEQKEKIYTIEQLSRNFGVSTKTISRWRKKGLFAKRFIFDDGKRRLGFVQSNIDKFTMEHSQVIVKANKFSRLTAKQKLDIIKQITLLASGGNLSRHQVIEKMAAKTNRAKETIRYTLADYEKKNPNSSIFGASSGIIEPARASELYELFKRGSSVGELTTRFNRSRSSIYRIVNYLKAGEVLAKKIEFISSDEFSERTAEGKILSGPIRVEEFVNRQYSDFSESYGGSLHKYIRSLKYSHPLNRSQEMELFRRYNYLKFLAYNARKSIKLKCASGRRLKEIESRLAEAEAIKKIIIEANLRLVISIANRHIISGTNLQDLVSEGNFSLMRAIEKFDYTKGFRFATYASWAVAKDYARKIPAEATRPDKAKASSFTNVQRDLRTSESAKVVAIESARQSLVQVIKDNLSEREQYIIINHFGLTGSLIRKNKKTLKQIGDDLDLSKERIRQIELLSLQKLRYALSIEQFELLTG